MKKAVIELHKAMVERSKNPYDYNGNEISISAMYHSEVFVGRGIENIAEYLSEEYEIKPRGSDLYPYEVVVNKDGVRYYQLITAEQKESLKREAEKVKENCTTESEVLSNVPGM